MMTLPEDDKPVHPSTTNAITMVASAFSGYQSGDDVPYIDAASPNTHPDCLFTMASLFGLSPAPVTKCRFLSLATFEGSNLIAMAASLPSSEFIGITHSQREHEEANSKISTLQLNNIEIRLLDIMDVNSDFGEFDYIIAQGIYSWVESEKRKRILQLCKKLLNANGIAYVNYNAYPGWRMHQALREMMLYHVHDEINNKEIINKARQFSDILTKTAHQADHLYGLLMQSELDMMKTWSDDYLLHDTLGPVNQPFYFHEFIEEAEKENLQFVSDAEFHSMVPNKFPEEALHLLKNLGNDRIAIEQNMDFFRNRMFKQTLLCHDSVKLTPHLYLEAFKSLYYVAPISPVSSIPDIHTDKAKTFKTIDNISISATDPIMKALLSYLSTQYPVPKSFDDIVHNLKTILGTDYQYVAKKGKLISFDQAVMRILMDCYGVGMLKAFAHPIDVTGMIGDKPKITKLARFEAAHGLIVTNQLHQGMRIDIFTHHVLPHLNGENTIDDIVAKLMELAEEGKISFRKGDAAIEDVAEIKNYMRNRVIHLISDIAKLALLIP